MKKEQNKPEDIAEMSIEMRANIFKDFSQYKNREEMLIDKWAISKTGVRSYHFDLLNEYENKFVKKFEKNMNDTFMFTKYAVQYTTEMFEGKPKEIKTGWFIPMVFWNKMWKDYESFRMTENKIDKVLSNSI